MPSPPVTPSPVAYCPRCGSRLPSLSALAGLARELVFRGVAARDALSSMKLAIPSVVPSALEDLAGRRGPGLIHALDCHSGTCLRAPERALEPPNGPSAELSKEGNSL